MFRTKGLVIFKRCIILLLAVGIGAVCHYARVAGNARVSGKNISRGVWVTVFSEKRVLFSKQGMSDLVACCEKNGIDSIYLQIYRAGEAWFDSRMAGRERYTAMVAAAGGDPIDFLIDAAQKRGIKVYGWINVLSIAQNLDAPIVRKYGRDILTLDQRERLPLKSNQGENQIFLEPGDERVVRYALKLVGEVMERYPSLDGIHLDYIRYPKAIPPIRFLFFFLRKPGITSYGFTERNVARFKLATGRDPRKDPWSREWNAWKRKQITGLVKKIRERVKTGRPGWKVSCAVVPSAELAASKSAQEWPQWLRRGIVDYVVMMNYTTNEEKFIEQVSQAQALGYGSRVHVGVAVYMFKNKKGTLNGLLQRLEAGRPAGIVYFAYDDVAGGIIEIPGANPREMQSRPHTLKGSL
jgi:uncharacterized lipoprotein YddW (UPF0748 family)